jgi:hypothetical protein
MAVMDDDEDVPDSRFAARVMLFDDKGLLPKDGLPEVQVWNQASLGKINKNKAPSDGGIVSVLVLICGKYVKEYHLSRERRRERGALLHRGAV